MLKRWLTYTVVPSREQKFAQPHYIGLKDVMLSTKKELSPPNSHSDRPLLPIQLMESRIHKQVWYPVISSNMPIRVHHESWATAHQVQPMPFNLGLPHASRSLHRRLSLAISTLDHW